jgi:hypothetical protein
MRNSANIDHKKWPGLIVGLHLGTTDPGGVLSVVDARCRFASVDRTQGGPLSDRANYSGATAGAASDHSSKKSIKNMQSSEPNITAFNTLITNFRKQARSWV